MSVDDRLRRAMELGRRAREEAEELGRDREQTQRQIAESLDREQRDLLARCWAGKALYVYIAQVPSEAMVLRTLIELGLVACSPDARGPDTTSRGRAVIGKLPRAT